MNDIVLLAVSIYLLKQDVSENVPFQQEDEMAPETLSPTTDVRRSRAAESPRVANPASAYAASQCGNIARKIRGPRAFLVFRPAELKQS